MRTSNKIQKGVTLEQKWSHLLHQEGLPFLIQAQLLRQLGAGQIDLARVIKAKDQWLLEIYEVKNHPFLSGKQRQRLIGSMTFLAQLMGLPVRFGLLGPF